MNEALFVTEEATIRDCLRAMDAGKLGIALVVDEERVLRGIVTDSDVRRLVIDGVNLDAPVNGYINRHPVTARPDIPRDELLHLFQSTTKGQIPLVDERGRVLGMETFAHFFLGEPRSETVVIMAGGLGTRLRPLTNGTPKPMLEIGGKPLLEVIITQLREHGFRRVLLSVNYRADCIETHFGDGGRFGVQIEYVREREQLGTAGALRLAREQLLGGGPFVVMNGDLLTKVNFSALLDYHRLHQAVATMSVTEYPFTVPYGVVRTTDVRVARIEEKPTLRFQVNAGIYVLEPRALHVIPDEGRCDMTQLIESLIERQETVACFPIREYWLDIGQLPDYKKAALDYAELF